MIFSRKLISLNLAILLLGNLLPFNYSLADSTFQNELDYYNRYIAAKPWDKQITQTVAYPNTACQTYGNVEVSFQVKETHGIARDNSPIRSGMPLPKSANVLYPNELQIFDSNNVRVPAQFRVLSRWDGENQDISKPIKWVLADFQTSLAANEAKTFTLKTGACDFYNYSLIELDDANNLVINTGTAKYVISKKHFNIFDQVLVENKEIISNLEANGVVVHKKDGSDYTSKNDPVNDLQIMVEEAGPLSIVVRITGKHFTDTDKNLNLDDGQVYHYWQGGTNATKRPGRPTFSFLNYTLRLQFYKNKSFVRANYTLENPERFGDMRLNIMNQSIPHEFDAFNLRLQTTMKDNLSYTFGGEAETLDEYPDKSSDSEKGLDYYTGNVMGNELAAIYQDSSGLKNWQDNSNKTWGTSLRGFRLYKNSQDVNNGLQASGWADLNDGQKGMTIGMRSFWQNFPKALTVSGSGYVDMGLFPEQFKLNHTFDGGRMKSHDLFFNFYAGQKTPQTLAGIAADFEYPLMATFSPSWYQETMALGLISTEGTGDDYFLLEPAANAVIRDNEIPSGLQDRTIYNERLRQDEYGWLNFGDTYRSGSKEMAMWGNNEFDFSYDLLLQYLRKNDHDIRFFENGSAMALHTANIDIYHTDEDESSYSHGMRMHDYTGVSMHDEQPSMSHYWIKGLLTYYLLTGNEEIREQAEETAYWMESMLSPATGDLYYHGESRSQAWPALALLDLYDFTGKNNYLYLASRLLYGEVIEEQDLVGVSYPYPYLDWEGNKGEKNKTNVCVWCNGYVFEALGRYALTKRLRNETDPKAELALQRLGDSLWSYGLAREDNNLFNNTADTKDNLVYGVKYKTLILDRIYSDGQKGVKSYEISYATQHVLANGFAYLALLFNSNDYLYKGRESWIWSMGPETYPGLPASYPIYDDGGNNPAKNKGYQLRFGQEYLFAKQKGTTLLSEINQTPPPVIIPPVTPPVTPPVIPVPPSPDINKPKPHPLTAFKDLSHDINKPYIEKIYNKGVEFKTKDSSYFFPERPLSRGEFLRLTLLSAGMPIEKSPSQKPFPDVNLKNNEYLDYIYTAKKRKIIQGYPDGTFKQNRYINRAEAIKIVMETADKKVHRSKKNFRDVGFTAWFSKYTAYLKSENITLGKPGNSFQPAKLLSRGEAAKFIVKILGLK